MNSSPTIRRFSSGLGHALEPREEALRRVDVDERDVEVALEGLDHLRGLVLAQQAVVDEHAGQLVADRLVHEQRRDRGVDAARRARRARARGRPARGSARPAPRSRRRRSRSAARRRRRRGSSSAPPGRAACARPPGGTGRRRACARAPRSRRSASTSDPAVTSAPAGGAVTESRWLIQPVCSSGRPLPSAPPRRNVVLPNSDAPVRSTRPPRSCAISCMP